MSGFSSYEIARSGLFASERALYVTGHNISNVNTTGFSRQQAIIASSTPDNSGKFPQGLGATIEQIRQIRNTFIDNVYRAENELLGYQETRLKTINDIESILGEPMTDGLQSVLNQFWDSWNELSKNPESLTVRALVRQRANALVEQFNHTGEQLNKLQEDLSSEIGVRVNELNNLSSKIADLNIKILKTENSGDMANDLRDERATYIDRLSKLVNIGVSERQDGMVDIDIAGRSLVSHGEASKIYSGENKVGSVFNAPRWELGNQLVDIRSGILKGLLEARGESVVGTIDSVTNGSPSVKTDITFAVDLSNDTFGTTNLQYIKDHIGEFIDRLENKGIDYRFNLITFGGAPGADVPQQFTNRASFEAAIAGLTTRSTSTDNDFFSVINRLQNDVTYRNESNRYLMVFTNETVQGDGVNVTAPALQTQINNLNQLGIKTFVASNTSYMNDTNPEPGWQTISDETGGKMYDLAAANFDTMGIDIGTDVNAEISTLPVSKDIIPDIKRRLNALINIIVREVNSLHKTGRDIDGNAGQDFFLKINDDFALQMGNIKINPIFNDLDRIAAAKMAAQGDNALAQEIVSLRHASLFGDIEESQNGDDFYRSVILTIGNLGTEAQRITDGQTKLLQSAENQRTAISGVSMDEEMSNMIKFQYSYNAATKMVSLIDECFEHIINKLGTQGR
ncbi:MAG: flagellar hook-associated protein FlgK [Deltaproteobacteria bacterium]